MPTITKLVCRNIALLFTLASRLRWALLILIFFSSALSASADYRLSAGDVFEISIVGIPELKRSVTIETDGHISFPLMGSALVAGLSLAEARTRIQIALASKIYRQTTPDGFERAILIQPEDVIVTVAKYRPIFVKGDVIRPGEYTFRLDLTVRQLIALAGGYNVGGINTKDPFITLADLRSEHEALWVEFTKEKTRIWRLSAQIGEKKVDRNNVSRSIPITAPIQRSTISSIVDFATKQLEHLQSNYQREQAFNRKSIKKLDEQIAVISAQEKKEQEGVEADTAELKKLLTLLKKGILPAARLTEARRGLLLSSTRKLQTTAQLIAMQNQKDNLLRQFEKLTDERKLRSLVEWEIADLRLREIKLKLRTIKEKIQYIANLKPHHDATGDGNGPEIVIYRREKKKGWKRLDANEAFELEPGDFVEVRVHRPHYFLEAPAPAKLNKSASRSP